MTLLGEVAMARKGAGPYVTFRASRAAELLSVG